MDWCKKNQQRFKFLKLDPRAFMNYAINEKENEESAKEGEEEVSSVQERDWKMAASRQKF